MRIRMQDISERQLLKPVIGDHVLYEGEEHVVTSVGVRWLYMYSANDPRKTNKIAKITSVIKKVPGADVQA